MNSSFALRLLPIMSPNNYKSRKEFKKQRRCIAIVQNECNVQSCESATPFLAVLNAGLSTGLTEERVLTAAAPHGKLRRLVMLHGKSYCFLECASSDDAHRIFSAMHGAAKIGQNDAVVYMGFFQQLPEQSENQWSKSLPPGLLLLPDFVSTEEEAALLQAIGADVAAGEDEPVIDALKHRRVKHFGFEFLYDSNVVDPSRPLQQGIPAACDVLWPRLQLAATKRGLSLEWQIPDQLTVNEYMPGQGIPPHVDTHSAFLEPILSLSLQSDVVMDFRRGSERVSVILPQRSMLIMGGEARFDWTHGITPRITDVVPTASGALTTQPRAKRTSLTFRCLRRAPCNCKFPALCDTQLKTPAVSPVPALREVAVRLEELNVHSVYEEIANHFSDTRHTPWPQVVAFLDSFAPGSVVVDLGCGNGKYLECNQNIITIGCDRSLGLLATCVANKKRAVFRCDCLHVPIRSATVDGCISIAVIHHLATAERRLAAVREMARLLRQGGRALIYVWAKDQCGDAKKSSYLRQNKAVNKQKTTEQLQRQQQQQQLEHHLQEERIIDLPIHTNRTDFQQQDVLVPWKLKTTHTQQSPAPSTFLRYYHVFAEHELEQLVALVPEVMLLRSYYDQGNCCAIFERK